jgi:hypothetical protein
VASLGSYALSQYLAEFNPTAVWVRLAKTHEYHILFGHNVDVLSVLAGGEVGMPVRDLAVYPPEVLILRRRVGRRIQASGFVYPGCGE